MIPVWAWCEVTKRYEVFPTHLLDTFEDGRQGFTFIPNVSTFEKREAFMRFRQCFEPNPVAWPGRFPYGFQYLLKKQL